MFGFVFTNNNIFMYGQCTYRWKGKPNIIIIHILFYFWPKSKACTCVCVYDICIYVWTYMCVQVCKGKGKSVPLQAWSGPEGSRKLRFPDFMTTAQEGCKVVSLTHLPHLTPGNPPGTRFCQRLSRPQGHGEIGRNMSMKNSNGTILVLLLNRRS